MEIIVCKVLDIREFQSKNYHIILEDFNANRYSLYIFEEKIYLNDEPFNNCFYHDILIKDDNVTMYINRDIRKIKFAI